MRTKRALIFCMMGLILWATWDIRANVEEYSGKITQGATADNSDVISTEYIEEIIINSGEFFRQAMINKMEISDSASAPVGLYIKQRKLWMPENERGFYYVWSDIDGSGQPELIVLRKTAETDSYEIHFYIMDEENEIQELNRVGSVVIQTDSFPEQASDLELNEKRVIASHVFGAEGDVIHEYGVVGGEYVLIRELIDENHWDTMTSTLSYYETGVLVKEHDLSDMSGDEFEALYPDLDFWIKG